MDAQDFTGRVAIVTGAGGGLGRAYALDLARRGARVVVNDIGGADAVVAEIAAAGGTAIASADSVATRAGGRAVAEAALDGFGRIDILISNAGILRHGRFDEITEDELDAVIDVHLKGAFHVGQPCFAAMKRQGYGRLLFTASSSGVFGHPWQAHYGAAKAGLVGLSNVLAVEGRAFGVLANAIMPNAKTAMAAELDLGWLEEAPDLAAQLATLGNPATAHRLEPAWVTALAVYLVSEASTTTHGVFSAAMGRFARVASALAPGWTAATLPAAEDIAALWPAITAIAGFAEPHSVYDEAAAIAASLTTETA